MSGGLPKDWEKTTQKYINDYRRIRRKSPPVRLRKIRLTLWPLATGAARRFGGSGSQQPTIWKGSVSLKEDPAGNYIH